VRGDGAGISPRAETRLSAISGEEHRLLSPPYAYASPRFDECTGFLERRRSWKASASATTPLAVPYSIYGSSSMRHFERKLPAHAPVTAQYQRKAPRKPLRVNDTGVCSAPVGCLARRSHRDCGSMSRAWSQYIASRLIRHFSNDCRPPGKQSP
jgi:hypothetical protein